MLPRTRLVQGQLDVTGHAAPGNVHVVRVPRGPHPPGGRPLVLFDDLEPERGTWGQGSALHGTHPTAAAGLCQRGTIKVAAHNVPVATDPGGWRTPARSGMASSRTWHG